MGDRQLAQQRIGGQLGYAYEAGVAVRILEGIANGETVTDLCAQPGMPTRNTVHRWVNTHPEFHRAFMAARELSAMAFEEQALGLAKKLYSPNDFNGTVVRAYEVAMGQLRWSAARRDPARYGQQNNQVIVVPIQINTTLDMGEGAASRNTAEHPDIYQIEARVIAEQPEGPLTPDPMEVGDAKVAPEMAGKRGRPKGVRNHQKLSPTGKLILKPPPKGG